MPFMREKIGYWLLKLCMTVTMVQSVAIHRPDIAPDGKGVWAPSGNLTHEGQEVPFEFLEGSIGGPKDLPISLGQTVY